MNQVTNETDVTEEVMKSLLETEADRKNNAITIDAAKKNLNHVCRFLSGAARALITP